jgi:hypothetical protein
MSRARLDRLVGIRQAYPSLPGKNQLDDIDRAAVEDVVRQLGERRAGKQTVSSSWCVRGFARQTSADTW